MHKRVLVIDDEERLRRLISRIIELEGMEVIQAESGTAALKKLENTDFDVIISDVKLPDVNGVDYVKKIKSIQPFAEVILMTAYGTIPDGVQSIKNGAFDYITKGDDNNRILPILYRALDKAELSKRLKDLEQSISKKYSFEQIIGKSQQIREAISIAKRVAATDVTALLTGETGTGKEVFAQSIHYASERASRSFVALNCSAFSSELLESELFGHKAGAFTGATRDKKGLFEEAHKGTIFLDEIGEMPMSLQAKILRVLESGEFIKVGETKVTKVDVRIIAATNRDLEQEIEQGRFRSDLFYRISVLRITLPSLHERAGDIKMLAEEFIKQCSVKIGRKPLAFDNEYIYALESCRWKGNIRELKNVIERSVILCNGYILTTADLPYEILHPAIDSPNDKSSMSMSSIEKKHIQKVLNYTKGNKSEAARLLEIGSATLYRKIEEYKI